MKVLRYSIILLSVFAFAYCSPDNPDPKKPEQSNTDPHDPGDPGDPGDPPVVDPPVVDPPAPTTTVLATLFTEDFDHNPSYSGFMSESGWSNIGGTGSASVTYSTWNSSIYNNNYGSSGAYQGASGTCYANIYQSNSGVYGYYIINGISTGTYKNFRLRFGAIQTNEVLGLEVCHNGNDWTSLKYSNGRSYNSWGQAEICFSVAGGNGTMAFKFTVLKPKSDYTYGGKLDDIVLEAVDTEYETVIGTEQGGGGGGSSQLISRYAELPVIDNTNADYYYNTLYASTVNSHKYVRNFSFCYDTRRHNPIWVAFPMHSIYAEGYGRSKDDNGNDPWMKYPDLPLDKQSIIWDEGDDGYMYWSAQSSILGGNGSWTKGHLCMSSSREGAGEDINLQTFYPINIAPQSNTYAGAGIFGNLWSKTEDFHWRRGSQICSDTLYVVAGCHYANDNNVEYDACNWNNHSSNSKACIIPTHQYKLFLRTRSGSLGKAVDKCSASELKTIAFWFDSVPATGSSANVEDYAVSVAEVERRTGLTFFPDIPSEVKNQCEPRDWGLQ